MYTTIIADDEKLICEAIQSVLNSAVPELEDIHVFYNGAEAYDYGQEHFLMPCIRADGERF